MKSKDFVLIGFSVILGIIFSIIISKLIFSSSYANQQVEVVPTISANFPNPDHQYFNRKAIDITEFISIGNNANPNPFYNPTASTQ
jgi:hypothetical protein